MALIKRLIDFIISPYTQYKQKQLDKQLEIQQDEAELVAQKKRIEELRKRDPFIYK